MCVLRRFSNVRLFETLCTIAHQSPLSWGFSRQEDWSGLLCPPPQDLPDPGIESTSVVSPALAGRFLPLAPPGKHPRALYQSLFVVSVLVVLIIFKRRERFSLYS